MQATATYNTLIIVVFRKRQQSNKLFIVYCPSASLKIIKGKKNTFITRKPFKTAVLKKKVIKGNFHVPHSRFRKWTST